MIWDKRKGEFNVELDADERVASGSGAANDTSFAAMVARDLARWRAQRRGEGMDVDGENDPNAMDVDMPPPLQRLQRTPTPPTPPVPKVELSVEARLFLELSKNPIPKPEDDDLPDFEDDEEEVDELDEEDPEEVERKVREAEEKAEQERVRREAEKERSEEIQKGKIEELEALRCVSVLLFLRQVGPHESSTCLGWKGRRS